MNCNPTEIENTEKFSTVRMQYRKTQEFFLDKSQGIHRFLHLSTSSSQRASHTTLVTVVTEQF
jgi:hypothetical protein